MRRLGFVSVVALALCSSMLIAQGGASGPYKVLKRAKVGGEGGTDYIYADSVGRRLYITRGRVGGSPATDTMPAVPAGDKHMQIFNLDTLDKVGDVVGIGGNGAAVCPKTGHGFTSDKPDPAMFDVATMKLIKTIPVPAPATPDGPKFGTDGIYCDTFNDRVYVGSHPTKSLMVIDAKDGTMLGEIKLNGTPEQTTSDGKGLVYQVLQDRPGGVDVIDAKTMKIIATYKFGDEATGNGSCNGLALDAKNGILFAACAGVGPAAARGAAPAPPPPAGTPGPQAFVIMNAKDGKIITRIPLAGSSDGAAFNPETMEAFSTHSNGTMTIVKENSPTSFVLEQNLDTMNGARTIAIDYKTGHLFCMAAEVGPPPPPPPAGTTPPNGGRGGGRGATIPGSFTVVMVGK